jgi:hypothetical protein
LAVATDWLQLDGMHPNSTSERFYNEMTARISALPPQKRPDAIFTLFGIGLKLMDRPTILELQVELQQRFPQTETERNLSTVLLEMIEGHLMLRDLAEGPNGPHELS